MPTALAAAMPCTPHQRTANSPATIVISSPAAIDSAGYQVGRAAEK